MRFSPTGSWKIADDSETVLIPNLSTAKTFWQRLIGLQFLRTLESNQGVLLQHCRSIHTMWMRFHIDVFFLDQELNIVEIHRNVKPWRFVMPKSKLVKHAIEVASPYGPQVDVGQRTFVDS